MISDENIYEWLTGPDQSELQKDLEDGNAVLVFAPDPGHVRLVFNDGTDQKEIPSGLMIEIYISRKVAAQIHADTADLFDFPASV